VAGPGAPEVKLKQSEPAATLCKIGLLRGSKGWTAIAKLLGTSSASAQTWAKLWKRLKITADRNFGEPQVTKSV
jgi:hypothetical protein